MQREAWLNVGLVSNMRMAAAGIPYELLNAKPENVERESEIVAQSGRRGAVTISTNMAGRGTDILLGGNPEYMARVNTLNPSFPSHMLAAQAVTHLCTHFPQS